MSYPAYEISQINEAINKSKENKAAMIASGGWGIDRLLDYCRNNLTQDDLFKAEDIIEKLKEYIKRNCEKKFETKGYARKLVSDLKSILRNHYK